MADSAGTKTEYTGTAFQGWILVSAAWLSTMAIQVVSPILPRMTQYFSDQPSGDVLKSLFSAVRLRKQAA